MKTELGKAIYQQPESEVIRLCLDESLLQFQSEPTPGGGEGIGGGQDL